MRRLGLLPILLAIAGIACETREASRGDSSSGAQHVRFERNEIAAAMPEQCSTLRDVVPPDLVALEGDLLLHLDEAEGLTITNVSDPARPRTAGRIPFVGAPLALHVRPPLAWVAYVDWDVPGAVTVVQAIDISRPDAPRIVGTSSRRGMATGTALVGGVLYMMSADGRATSLAAFRADAPRLLAGELTLEGAPGALAASPVGLATVTTVEDATLVSWIDLAYDRPGAMNVRGVRRVDGRFPAWEGDIVDADEGQAVRFLACSTKACAADEDAFVRVVDFARGADDIRMALRVRVGTGVPVVRFSGDRLYVADDTSLRVVKLHPTPHVAGTVALSGTISALHADATRVLAVGTMGTPSTGIHVAVHDVDVRVASLPSLRGTTTFGHDWTSTRANDDARAISVDPSRDLLALPFSTWRARDARYATGAQVLALGHGAPSLRAAFPADGHVERVVFVGDHLVAVGGGTVTTLDPASERELEVR